MRKRDCCVCNCLKHPYHSDCKDGCCKLYEDIENEQIQQKDLNKTKINKV